MSPCSTGCAMPELASPDVSGVVEGQRGRSAAGSRRRPGALLDATVVREPGKTGSQWRIHYSLRLPTLECDHFDLTAASGAAESSGDFAFRLESWCWPMPATAILPVSPRWRAKAYVCVRLSPLDATFDERGRPFPLLKRLASCARPAISPVAGRSVGHDGSHWGRSAR